MRTARNRMQSIVTCQSQGSPRSRGQIALGDLLPGVSRSRRSTRAWAIDFIVIAAARAARLLIKSTHGDDHRRYEWATCSPAIRCHECHIDYANAHAMRRSKVAGRPSSVVLSPETLAFDSAADEAASAPARKTSASRPSPVAGSCRSIFDSWVWTLVIRKVAGRCRGG